MEPKLGQFVNWVVHVPDNGHLLPRTTQHARRGRSRHRERSSLAGWHQVGIEEPRHVPETLLRQCVLTASRYKIEVARPGFEPGTP